MRWQFEAPDHDTAHAYSLARIAAALDTSEEPEQKFQRVATVRGAKKSARPARAAS
ncbi:hypothetical protein [Streptomyces sp. NBC_01353]|uniref:hypothetical protein n=1 Tax=Streptomyces sp. NBC_01353 TaxID=2903835 RepID=UPI002E339B12|nr:hypothetical protein [Streptomyces sp. NBC_01353]